MKLTRSRVLVACLAVVSAAALLLWQQGRVLWCACGSYAPWSGAIWSKHNSQHLADPYSFTHGLHGFVFFALLAPLRRWVSLPARFLLAIAAESAWEILENSEAVIQKYREATISLDYFGDSVANSVADVVCCGLGFLLVSRMRPWQALALFVVVELVLAWWIRDSLLMNVLMLVYPLEVVKQWQLAGAP